MNNQISNLKVEVSTGMNLNDKDYMNSALSCLKEMVKNYAVVLTEVSNENLFNKYKVVFDNVCGLQREAYELMFQRGWYTIEKAETTKVSNKYNTLLQEYQELNLS